MGDVPLPNLPGLGQQLLRDQRAALEEGAAAGALVIVDRIGSASPDDFWDTHIVELDDLVSLYDGGADDLTIGPPDHPLMDENLVPVVEK
jgi:hypothetical protein